jgi:hypothetical protein
MLNIKFRTEAVGARAATRYGSWSGVRSTKMMTTCHMHVNSLNINGLKLNILILFLFKKVTKFSAWRLVNFADSSIRKSQLLLSNANFWQTHCRAWELFYSFSDVWGLILANLDKYSLNSLIDTTVVCSLNTVKYLL